METPAAEPLDEALARVARLDIAGLRALWLSLNREAAPKSLTGDMLARIIAYRLQEERRGGLSRSTRKRLDQLARSDSEPVRHLKVGTVVVREYQGVVHEVMVVPGGFSWQKNTYASLSTIARAITGTSWNGPRFFGLRGNGSEKLETSQAASVIEAKAPTRVSVRARRTGDQIAECKR